MNAWTEFWTQFFFQLSSILPWFAAGAAAVAAVSLTPLGRALTRYLRDARTRAVEQGDDPGLATLRSDITEVLERLEFLERAIVQQRLAAPHAAAPDPARGPASPEAAEERIPTPT